MAGGAAGNMFDRLIRGFVPDMIETQFVNFPVFNVADSCLVAGCVMMMICILTKGIENNS
jgi:signal peptidase II